MDDLKNKRMSSKLSGQYVQINWYMQAESLRTKRPNSLSQRRWELMSKNNNLDQEPSNVL